MGFITTFTARDFNRDTSGAKRAAQHGPVFITDRGRPAYVLLSIEAWRSLSGEEPAIGELIGDIDGAAIDFDPQPLRGPLTRPVDLS